MKNPDNMPGPDFIAQPSPQLKPAGHSYAERREGAPPSGIERLLESQQGYIVGRLENKILRLNTDGHLLTIAPTRSGKGISCIIPNLLDHPGSAFVIDIKGETVERTADARLLMGQNVVVLDPYKVTGGRWGYDAFNPLDALKPGVAGFEQDVRRLARAIMFDPEGRSSREPIWDNATILALGSALLYIKTYLPSDRRSLHELNRLFSLQADRRAMIAEEIAQAVADGNGQYEQALNILIEFITAGSEKTRIPDNTVVQLMTILRWISDEDFRGILDHSTFSFERIQHEPTTIYLVLPEEHIEGCGVWVRMLFDAALFALKETTSVFGVPSNALDQSQRVLFLLDEFPAFGKLQPVEAGMATVAGRGATLWLFIQHISQLAKLYGEHSAQQIVGNASMLQAFESTEIHELEYLSRVVGEEMFDVQGVTVTVNESIGGSDSTGRTISLSNTESLTLSTSQSTTKGEQHTRTEGTATNVVHATTDTVSAGVNESTGSGTSTTIGTNRGTGGGVGTNTSENSGLSGTHTILDQLGIDLPVWETKNRGAGRGRSDSRNWSRGISSSRSRAENTSRGSNRSISHADSLSKSTGVNQTESVGSSYSEMVGTARSTTSGTTQGESTTETKAETFSRGVGVSYSVRPEQRRIETPRSLRSSISGGSQLLQLRGQSAFIAPRLAYFERDPRNGFYRFPQMALLSGATTLEALWWGQMKRVVPPLPAPLSPPVNPFRTAASALSSITADIPYPRDPQGLDEKSRQIRDIVIQAISDSRELLPAVTARLVGMWEAMDDHRRALLAFYQFLSNVYPLTDSGSLDGNIDLLAHATSPEEIRRLLAEREVLHFKGLLLFEADEIAAIVSTAPPADPKYAEAAVIHGPWLLRQYQGSIDRAVEKFMEVPRRHCTGHMSQHERVEASMPTLIRAIEEAVAKILLDAVKTNAARRYQQQSG